MSMPYSTLVYAPKPASLLALIIALPMVSIYVLFALIARSGSGVGEGDGVGAVAAVGAGVEVGAGAAVGVAPGLFVGILPFYYFFNRLANK